nr:Rieske (2Fe-2S) protein [uncultured Pseudomonas sp.]
MDFDWQSEPNAPAPGAVLCALEDLQSETVREVRVGEEAPFRVLLYRKGDQVRAYVNRCPHHWIPLNKAPDQFLRWADDEIMCVHHCAVFNLVEEGTCTMGPCQGSNLIGVPVRVQRGSVVIAGADRE